MTNDSVYNFLNSTFIMQCITLLSLDRSDIFPNHYIQRQVKRVYSFFQFRQRAQSLVAFVSAADDPRECKLSNKLDDEKVIRTELF